MRRGRALSLLLVLAAASLAGCAKDEGAVALETLSLGTVAGTVTDARLKPLAGASVRVEGANATATTDATGAFEVRVPPGEYLVLASLDGFRGGALRAAPGAGETARLAFALQPVPVETPEVQVQEQHGLLSCGAALLLAEDERRLACGGSDPNQRARLVFPVTQAHGLEGAVVEIAWEAHSQAAAWLHVLVTSGEGEGAAFVAQTEARSPIVLSIPGRVLAPLVASGGALALEVTPTGSLTDEEAGVDGGAAFQQPFAAYVSLFYHQPQPTGYTILRPADG